MRRVLPFITMIVLLPSVSLFAEDPAVFSGPQVGERLTPLKVVGVYNDEKGKEFDLVEMADGKPTLLVIIHNVTRPAGNIARALIHYCETRKDDGLFTGLVLLTDDITGMEQFMSRTQWWSDGSPVGLSVDGGEGPGSYGLNRNVNVTVLVAKDNIVTANFALVQPSLPEVPKILGEVQKHIGGETLTIPEVTFLEAPTRLRSGPGPKDLKLRELMCSILRTKDPKYATEIDAYVGSDKEKQKELGRAVSVVMAPTYGGKESIILSAPGLKTIFEAWAEKYPSGDDSGRGMKNKGMKAKK